MMSRISLIAIIAPLYLTCLSDAFQVTPEPVGTSHRSPGSWRISSSSVVLSMGLFDGIQSMFSEEAKQKREQERQRQIEEQEAMQREILERRRNPEKMQQYMDARKERLRQYTDDREVVVVDDSESNKNSASSVSQDEQAEEPMDDGNVEEKQGSGDDPVGDFLGNIFGKK